MKEKKDLAVNSEGQKELDKAQRQFEDFDSNIKQMTMDRMNAAPKEDVEPQTKIAQRDIDKMNDIWLKPKRAIGSREKFNERFRDEYNFQKEYVKFIAENKEIIGETIELWTKPFPGIPAEEWNVPTNKPIWGPRYLAERLKACIYHRLVMKDHVMTEKGMFGQVYGAMAVDTTVNRLDAMPVSTRKSIFMGANNF